MLGVCIVTEMLVAVLNVCGDEDDMDDAGSISSLISCNIIL